MADQAFHFTVHRATYTVLAIANMDAADRFAVEYGIPDDATGCDPGSRLWLPAKRCGAQGVVTNSEMPLIFDVPGDYRLVWDSAPNPDVVVYADEGIQNAKGTVVPRAT